MTGSALEVGSLLDDLEHVDDGRGAGESLRPEVHRRVLADVLPLLAEERDPAAAGGVPLPEAWECVRAVLGGASRDDLEAAHGERGPGPNIRGAEAEQAVNRRAVEGTHLPPGLHIVTGQTGGGKSALVVNLAHAAIGTGHPVLYVSLELDAEELAARLLALDTAHTDEVGEGRPGRGLSWAALALRRAMRPEDQERRAAGIRALEERARQFVALVPDGPFPLGMIREEALALWQEHGRPPLVVFDYLQAASIQGPDSYRAPLREHVAMVTMELRRLSRAMPDVVREDGETWHGCPVVVLSITARSNVKGQERAPGMDGRSPDKLRFADLETLKALPKEAGEVEATAVTAWVMALGEAEGAEGTRPLTLRLVKNRLGRAGQWVPFRFHGATGWLEEEPERYRTAPLTEATEEAAQLERLAERGEAKQAAKKRNGKDTRRAIVGPVDDVEAF